MIRVLHSVSYMSRGGIETMLMNYYRHIDRSKIQFDFLCHSNERGAYDDEIESLGGRIYRTPGLNPLRFPAYLRYMSLLFQNNPQYRIIESHNGPFGVYSLFAAKRSNIPVRIYHAHGAGLEYDWKYLMKAVCKKMIKYQCNHKFICGEKAGRFYFGDKTINDGDFYLIPNAIDIRRFVYSPEIRRELREKYGLSNKKIIGHVGRFSYEKNHEFLIRVFYESWKIDDSLFLVMLGDGVNWNKIRTLVEQLGIANHVLMLGNIPNVNEWYQAFDLFMLPSIREGLPVVGIEAQAADLPCIFSTAVTSEVRLGDRTQFIALDASLGIWRNAVLSALNHVYRRSDNYQKLTEKGYNIIEEAKKISDLYISMHN